MQGKDFLSDECERLLQTELARLDAAVLVLGDRPLTASQTVAEALAPACDADGLATLELYCTPASREFYGEHHPSTQQYARMALWRYTVQHRSAMYDVTLA